MMVIMTTLQYILYCSCTTYFEGYSLFSRIYTIDGHMDRCIEDFKSLLLHLLSSVGLDCDNGGKIQLYNSNNKNKKMVQEKEMELLMVLMVVVEFQDLVNPVRKMGFGKQIMKYLVGFCTCQFCD